MKKPKLKYIYPTQDDMYQYELEEEITLGQLIEETKNLPKHIQLVVSVCYYEHSYSIYFQGYKEEYLQKVRENQDKYDKEVQEYEEWLKNTPEYIRKQEKDRATAEKRKAARIKNLEKELARLKK